MSDLAPVLPQSEEEDSQQSLEDDEPDESSSSFAKTSNIRKSLVLSMAAVPANEAAECDPIMEENPHSVGGCDRTTMTVVSMYIMTVLHPFMAYVVYLVVPFYVLDETDWGYESFGMIFSVLSFGDICGSQIVPVAAMADSDLVLFVGHFTQFLGAGLGWILILSTNFTVFCAGAFLVGYSYGVSTVQAYCTAAANGDPDLEVELMANIGKLYMIGSIGYSMLLPPVYQYFGLPVFVMVEVILATIGVVCLAIVFSCLNEFSCSQDSDQDSSEFDSAASDKKDSLERGNSALAPVELETTVIPLSRILSPSLYILLFLKSMNCFIYQIYAVVTPVLFVGYGITSSYSGYMFSVAGVIGYLGMYAAQRSSLDYPYDYNFFSIIELIGFGFYIVFHAPWVAFAWHSVITGAFLTQAGLEMTTRLFLAPSQGFQQITGVVSVLQAVMYLFGSFISPYLLVPGQRFPFLVVILLTAATIVVSMLGYYARQQYLNIQLGDKFKNRSYLIKERTFYHSVDKSARRRGAFTDQKPSDVAEAIADQIEILQKEFSKARGISFIANPNASRNLENFVNTANSQKESETSRRESTLGALKASSVAVKQQRRSTLHGLRQFNGPGRLSVLKEKSTLSETYSKTRNMRASIVQSAEMFAREKALKKSSNQVSTAAAKPPPKRTVRMSMARKSVLRRCEPAAALNHGASDADNQAEGMQRAQRLMKNRTSMMFSRM